MTEPRSPVPRPPSLVPDADTPEWWLRRLVNELLTRQPILDKRERYVQGYHDLPKGNRDYMKALYELQRIAQSNYIGLVTSAPVERMTVYGFRFGEAGTADVDAQKIWQANDMDLQSAQIHARAAKFGLAYALVSPPEEGDEWPVITAEDPRTAIVARDPMRPMRSLAGLRMWADDTVGRILAILYLPEGAYGYVGPQIADLEGLTLKSIRERLTGQGLGANAFEQDGFVPNPEDFQEVPLVEYVWRPETGVIPEGEAGRDVRIIQDRINQTIFDRVVITHFQAYKQRYASGITIPKGRKGQRKPPFDPGASTLWTTENPDAKFGEFTSADLRQVAEIIRDDIADIAAITKTPAHYLMGKMANISGETLTQAESGLVSKTQQRMNSMGWSHERLIKLCFALRGDHEKAKNVEAATLWTDPQKQITAELALAGQQWAAIGIPLDLIMGRQGFSPDEQRYAVEEKEKADKQALAQQMQLSDQAHSQNMQMAKATGKMTPNKGTSGAPPSKKSTS